MVIRTLITGCSNIGHTRPEASFHSLTFLKCKKKLEYNNKYTWKITVRGTVRESKSVSIKQTRRRCKIRHFGRDSVSKPSVGSCSSTVFLVLSPTVHCVNCASAVLQHSFRLLTRLDAIQPQLYGSDLRIRKKKQPLESEQLIDLLLFSVKCKQCHCMHK